MYEPRGAIPKLFVLIFTTILGIVFNLPDQINVGIMILKQIAEVIAPLNIQQANQLVSNYIIWLRIFGVLLIAVSVLQIYRLFKAQEYF